MYLLLSSPKIFLRIAGINLCGGFQLGSGDLSLLILSVDLGDHIASVPTHGSGVSFGNSSIQPFESSILRTSVRRESDSFVFWIGEDADPFIDRPIHSLDMLEYSKHAGCEGIVVHYHQGSQRKISISRTSQGTSPLFACCFQNRLTLSWRYEDVLGAVGAINPDIEFCRRFVNGGSSRTREQIIRGTYNFWPGELISFGADGLAIEEASVRPIPSPTPIKDDGDVSGAFFELLKRELNRYRKRAKAPLVEVSGGLDSATLALAAGAVLEGASSYGLIQLGVAGQQQQRRRLELISKTGLIDFEIPANTIPPFAGLQAEECQVGVFDDNHRPSCAAALDTHPNGPFDLVIAGIGGDELMMENTYSSEDGEVSGVVCSSAVVAGAARADMFMRRGIWPINPLASIDIVDFCRSLPGAFRHKRELIRFNLARLGMSDGFLFPRYMEHYGEVMRREAAEVDFDRLFAGTFVSGLDGIGFNQVMDEARKAASGFPIPLHAKLWNMAKLNAVLRYHLA